MPWKIVNCDYDATRPHLHLKDPDAPVHLRTYLDDKKEVEICLGANHPDECPVRAVVGPDHVEVTATSFQRVHRQILESILSALDVQRADRADALAWMDETMQKGTTTPGWFPGNVTSHPRVTSWPHDLTDDDLRDAVRDRAISKPRYKTLLAEMRRRGLRFNDRQDQARAT